MQDNKYEIIEITDWTELRIIINNIYISSFNIIVPDLFNIKE